MLQDSNDYEAVTLGPNSVSVSEILTLLETYELSLDMTEGEIHNALVFTADQGHQIADEIDLIEAIQEAHAILTTH